MSRIGKLPIAVPTGVKIDLKYPHIKVTGPKGALEFVVNDEIDVTLDQEQILVVRKGETKKHRALHGLTRTLLANMVKGVNDGFTMKLQIVGIGYRVAVEKGDLVLHLGYSKPVHFPIPKGITIDVDKQNNIAIHGINKQEVGQIAADIRALRTVEPYKGKGIRYEGEQVQRKAGKSKTAK
ncbi:50S ribosomal protein L6 [bacterium]|nr:50S ribosomal protein L6 [bacterium]